MGQEFEIFLIYSSLLNYLRPLDRVFGATHMLIPYEKVPGLCIGVGNEGALMVRHLAKEISVLHILEKYWERSVRVEISPGDRGTRTARVIDMIRH